MSLRITFYPAKQMSEREFQVRRFVSDAVLDWGYKSGLSLALINDITEIIINDILKMTNQDRTVLDNTEPMFYIKQQTNDVEHTEICPRCNGEVLINKPSGNGFCLQCDYTVKGKFC